MNRSWIKEHQIVFSPLDKFPVCNPDLKLFEGYKLLINFLNNFECKLLFLFYPDFYIFIISKVADDIFLKCRKKILIVDSHRYNKYFIVLFILDFNFTLDTFNINPCD